MPETCFGRDKVLTGLKLTHTNKDDAQSEVERMPTVDKILAKARQGHQIVAIRGEARLFNH